MNFLFRLLWIVLLSLLMGCATTRYQADPQTVQKEIRKLETQLQKKPGDAGLLTELGKMHFLARNTEKTREYLTRALKKYPKNSEALFYLGLTLEFQNKNDLALKVYEKYAELPALSPWRRKLEGRYHWLTRQMIREEMRALLRQEGQLTRQLSPKSVAVFPFAFSGQNRRFAALGKGLAEMMITDLSQVQGLTVIERVRLQALLDEMALGQSGVVDALSAPRLGKLLGAGKMVRGNYNVLSNNQLRLDVAFWDVLKRKFPQATTQTDVLDNLFKLEKDMVFRLLAEMGIEPTPQERERIQRIPTKNMQAFLAYCIGLQEEDAGNFEAAARQFQKAATLDPAFRQAGQKAEAATASAGAGGSKEDLAAGLGGQAAGGSSGNTLVNNRLQNLNSSLGSTFVPGQDSREPAQEAGQSSGGAIIGGGALPEPPQPPGGR